MMLSRLAFAKNMKAESGRLGAFGSFFAFFAGLALEAPFAAFLAGDFFAFFGFAIAFLTAGAAHIARHERESQRGRDIGARSAAARASSELFM